MSCLRIRLVNPPVPNIRPSRGSHNAPGAPFFNHVPVVAGCHKAIFICRVYVQGRDINSFEIQTKSSGNETERTVYVLKPALLFLGFRPIDFKS